MPFKRESLLKVARVGASAPCWSDTSALVEQVANSVIEMILGALQELSASDPAARATEVGPVIDGEAIDTNSQAPETPAFIIESAASLGKSCASSS